MQLRRPPLMAGSAPRQTLRFLKDPFALIEEGTRLHGDVFSIRFLGFGTWTFLASPEHVKTMFKAPADVLVAGEANRAQLGFMLGTNASFSLDGEAHRQRQRLVHPTLNSHHQIHPHVPLIGRLTRRMIGAWPTDRPLPFLASAHRLSLDVMIHTLLAASDDHELDALGGLFDQFAGRGLRSPLIAMPYLQWDLGRFSPWGRVMHLRRRVMDALRQQIRRRCDSPEDFDDVVGRLAATAQKDGSYLTESALLEEVVNLLFAGHETTGTILTWTLECLLAHPQVLQRLLDELDDVLTGRPVAAEHLDQLPYLQAVIHEAIRFRPIAPMAGVRLVKQAFPIGDYELAPGSLVVQCFPAMARRPELFARPERFDPEHFYRRKMKPFTWNPFGGGTRMCIGRGLAELELKVALATLLQQVELTLAQDSVRAVRNGFFFAPDNGLQITWRPRRR